MSLILICYSWLSIETSLKLFFTKDMLLLSICFAYTGKKCYILVASLGRILDSVRGVSSLWVCLRDFQNHLATLWSFFSEWEKGGSVRPTQDSAVCTTVQLSYSILYGKGAVRNVLRGTYPSPPALIIWRLPENDITDLYYFFQDLLTYISSPPSLPLAIFKWLLFPDYT